MIRNILILFLAVVSLSANSQTQAPPYPIQHCAQQMPFGQPHGQKQNTTLICREAYMVEYDNRAKIAEWVSYVLIPQHAIGCSPRSNAFTADMSLPSEYRSLVKDYAKSGYDMGHLANDADMAWGESVERESFIMSNMTPQLPGFNRGIWKKLEDQTRAWASERYSPLLIYVGPIYDKQDQYIGKSGVTVPHAFFKIIVDMGTNEVMVYKFIHEPSSDDLSFFITSVAQIQKDTGVVFPLPKKALFSRIPWAASTKSVRKLKSASC